MIVAVVTLALAILAMGVGLIASMSWGRKAIDSKGIADEEKLSVERKCLDLEDDRDAERARAAKAESERDEAKKAGAVHEAAAKAAREELLKHVREKLATGSDDDVAAEVDRLLGLAVSKAEAVSNVPSTTTSNDRSPT